MMTDKNDTGLVRFAHMADLHIGAWREKELAAINMYAFKQAIALCITHKVDFVVISGDLFDGNIPDLGVAQEAVTILRALPDLGIPIYITVGSHDSSPSGASIIDILGAAGLFTKVNPDWVKLKGDERIRPPFVTDPKTGVKLAGLYGRKNGLERELFEALDPEWSTDEPGTKIFLFHSAISELQPVGEKFEEGVPKALLPPGFVYYAGGHIHTTITHHDHALGGPIVYPGPMLGYQIRDLEHQAAGAVRGIYVVDLDGDYLEDLVFVPVTLPDVIGEVIDAEGRDPSDVTALLSEVRDRFDVADAIVLLTVKGTLGSGAIHDIDFKQIRQGYRDDRAIVVKINRSGLRPPARAERVTAAGEDRAEIERAIFRQTLETFTPAGGMMDPDARARVDKTLGNEGGVKTAETLMAALQVEKKEGERKDDFIRRVIADADQVLHPGGV